MTQPEETNEVSLKILIWGSDSLTHKKLPITLYRHEKEMYCLGL